MSIAIEPSYLHLRELLSPKRSPASRYAPAENLPWRAATFSSADNEAKWDDLLRDLRMSLNSLANLAEDWDSYGAPPINLDQLEQASDFLNRVMLPGTPAPSILPTPLGSVQIEWHTEGIDFEVQTTSDSTFELSYVDSVKEQEWDETLENDWSRITEVMRELRRRRSQNL
jgi:hypothetical protein